MEKFKKSFIISMMIVTVFSMSMLAVPVSVDAAASAGDLIKMDGLSSVYYLGADNKRYVFPNEQTYFSWYSDFAGVVTVPQSELEGYSLGANVTMRPGTKLVKITTDPKVYAVESNGTLVHVPDEATALALYGSNWAQRVIDVPDAFFTNYTVSAETVSASVYPEGSLIKTADSSTVYYIDASGNARQVSTGVAFEANRFNWDDVITTTLVIPTLGTAIAAAESTLTDTSSGAGGQIVPGVGTGLTVSLASDTPTAGNIPAASPNPFLKLNLTASSDGAVSINTIKLSAFNLGLATKIDSITFYDDGVKVGTSKNMNTDRNATFNFSTPIEIAAGTTKSLVVKATIVAATTSGNFAIGIASASDVTTNGAAVSGSFPIQGNTQAVTDATIGTITMSSVDGTNTADINFGEDNIKLAGFDLAAAHEPVLWESARLKTAGTDDNNIVSNIRLLIDGDEIATSELVDKYINFDLSNYLIAKNDTVSVEVYGDIGIANVGNTIDLYIKEANDFSFVGQDYGYGIEIASIAALDAADDGIIVTLAAGDFTIDMDKTATPSKDVRAGDNDVVLATIKMTSNGENATINYITDSATDGDFYITGTGLAADTTTAASNNIDVDTVVLIDVNSGVSYDVTATASTTISGEDTQGWVLSITDEIVLVQGVTRTFELQVDIHDSTSGTAPDNGDTFKVVLEDGAFSVTGDESDASITNITPSSVTSAIATTRAASLTWTTIALTAKTVVAGAGAVGDPVVVYKAGLEVGESSDVTLTSVKISVDDSVYVSFKDDNIAQLDLYVDNKLVKSTSNDISGTDGANTAYITFTSLDTTNRVISAGADVELEVRAIFSSTFPTTGTFALEVDHASTSIVAKDKDNNNVEESVTNVSTLSRTMTLAAKGTLMVELKVDDSKANDNVYLLAGTGTVTDKYLGELVFTTANEAIKITDLALQEYLSSTGSDVKVVRLYDNDGVMVAEKTPTADGHVHFESDNFVNGAEILSADQATSYFIGVVAKSINALDDSEGTATFNAGIQYSIATSTGLAAFSDLSTDEAVKATGVDSGSDITIIEDTNGTVAAGEYSLGSVKTKTANITGSILTSIVNDKADGGIIAGSGKEIARYKFAFDNSNNRTSANVELKAEMNELILNIATSSNVTVTSFTAHLEGQSGTKVSASAEADSNGEVTFDLTGLPGSGLVDGVVTLVISGDVVVGGASYEYLSTELDNLVTDFTWNGDANVSATNYANSLLDYAEVIGATLSKS